MSIASPNLSPLPEEPPRPTPLACASCRRKHLKCDGRQPICARCAGRSLQCNYTPSRRGYRSSSSHDSEPAQELNLGTSRNDVQVLAEQPVLQSGDIFTGFLSQNVDHSGGSSGDYDERRMALLDCQTSTNGPPHPSSASDHSISTSSSIEAKYLVNLFYTYFHPAHPILIPKPFYSERGYPNYLLQVVYFIGSHYSSSISSDRLRAIAAEKVSDNAPKTTSMVQGRLLFAIALHGRNEIKEAQAMLARAVNLAEEIGMNEREFAATHGGQQSVEEESLRRTWWELYVVNSIMAAFWRKSEFNIHKFGSDVLLPCEEAAFADAACMSDPPTMAQFDNRLFADDEFQFSSFCYRIEAARILTRVLALTGNHDVHHDQVQAVDNALAGWAHHLPPAKADIIDKLGEVDEILFQAHMIIHYASLFLHFPRSNLLSTPAATAEIAGGQRDLHVSPSSTQHAHAIKATEASKQLSNLAALRLPVQNHTPFFICGLVLGAVVQLSACSVHSGNCVEQHRDRVALIIGVLKSLSRTWAFSQLVLKQIKKVAVEVLNIREIKTNRPLQLDTHDSGIDMMIGDDQNWLGNLDIQTLQSMMPFNMDMVYNEPERPYFEDGQMNM
ncbi:Transcriptional regulatory moc3 [Hyphodiscus hymeniophilus]|uniref:Transcriptional regulatory moc3 n=1 Tax=Hyphodiscus hymeniophilus TaxID=353542 RepID=A0A9P6SLW2_9HELO|nr:Transcriptional regulatory moc3 [Hyphodiscus hymeniophilus]